MSSNCYIFAKPLISMRNLSIYYIRNPRAYRLKFSPRNYWGWKKSYICFYIQIQNKIFVCIYDTPTPLRMFRTLHIYLFIYQVVYILFITYINIDILMLISKVIQHKSKYIYKFFMKEYLKHPFCIDLFKTQGMSILRV